MQVRELQNLQKILWGNEVLTGKLSDGFVGVQRKRRTFKQFFLSGIADDVNESQITSYLAKRNIKANNIFIFRSQRRGTISVKIGIPLASVSTVLEENFWPKYVQCKPWQYKENRRNPVVQDIIKTQAGNKQGVSKHIQGVSKKTQHLIF